MKTLRVSLLTVALTLAASTAQAQYSYPVWYKPATNTGQTNLVEQGTWTNSFIRWNITLNAGVYSYEYRFYGVGSPQSVSHVSMMSSDTCEQNQLACVRNANRSIEWGWNPRGIDGAEWPNSTAGTYPDNYTYYGPRFQFTGDPLTDGFGSYYLLTFDSDRAPMWGDVFIKGGASNYAYNVGLDGNRGSANIGDFIAVPNTTSTTTSTVPEPSTYVLMAAGLAGLGLAARRRKA